MNITITGRHLSVSDRLKDYTEKKFFKLETYFNQLINAHVILYVEKLNHGAEIIINGDGVQFHGRENSETLYSAIDQLCEKMEKQIVKYKEKHQTHKGPGKPAMAFFEISSETGTSVKLVQANNKPIDKIEAFLQMKVNDNNFLLFKKGISKVDSDLDYLNRNYAVMYKDEQGCRMVEIPFDNIKDSKFDENHFVEYDLQIKDDSLSSPKIDFKKQNSSSVKKLSIDQAIDEIKNTQSNFIPFFNTDSRYFNIVYKNGNGIEVLVPAF